METILQVIHARLKRNTLSPAPSSASVAHGVGGSDGVSGPSATSALTPSVGALTSTGHGSLAGLILSRQSSSSAVLATPSPLSLASPVAGAAFSVPGAAGIGTPTSTSGTGAAGSSSSSTSSSQLPQSPWSTAGPDYAIKIMEKRFIKKVS